MSTDKSDKFSSQNSEVLRVEFSIARSESACSTGVTYTLGVWWLGQVADDEGSNSGQQGGGQCKVHVVDPQETGNRLLLRPAVTFTLVQELESEADNAKYKSQHQRPESSLHTNML